MKSGLKIVLVIILLLNLVALVHEKHVISNMNDEKAKIDSQWKEVFRAGADRWAIVQELISQGTKEDKLLDTIQITLLQHTILRDQFAKACSLSYVESEYQIDQQLQYFMNAYFKDTTLIRGSYTSYVHQIKESNQRLNKLTEAYNAEVKKYNLNFSGFPNSYYARMNDLKPLVSFDWVYGFMNEDGVEINIKMVK